MHNLHLGNTNLSQAGRKMELQFVVAHQLHQRIAKQQPIIENQKICIYLKSKNSILLIFKCEISMYLQGGTV